MPPERPFAKAHLQEISPITGAGEIGIVPVRLRIGIESFGVNAYTAQAEGARVIEEHDELGHGAGRHEELYFVAVGHALFELDGKEVDAPAGTFVFVSDPTVRRSAIGREQGTTVLVVGGVTGQAFQASPWEAWLDAAPHLEKGANVESRSSSALSGRIRATRTCSTTSPARRRSRGGPTRRSRTSPRRSRRTRAPGRGRRRTRTSTRCGLTRASRADPA